MFTVVTGFFDIGRGEWDHYNRKIEEYLQHFRNLLSLKVNMVIFTESNFVELVEDVRKDVNCRTSIVTTKLSQLYMYEHLEKIKSILEIMLL